MMGEPRPWERSWDRTLRHIKIEYDAIMATSTQVGTIVLSTEGAKELLDLHEHCRALEVRIQQVERYHTATIKSRDQYKEQAERLEDFVEGLRKKLSEKKERVVRLEEEIEEVRASLESVLKDRKR